MKPTIVKLIALALLMVPVVAQAELVYNEDTHQRIIEAAYARLVSYTVLSEEPLSFDLGDFATIYPDQFDSIRWLDVVSLPDGMLIALNRARKTNETLGESRMQYELTWRSQKLALDTPEAIASLDMTIADTLAAVAAEQGSESQVEAITSYTVTVTLGSRSRTYNAAFLWTPAAAPKAFGSAFQVMDNVTQGVEEAVREAVAPLINPDFLQLTGDLEEPFRQKAYCYNTATYYSQPDQFPIKSGWHGDGYRHLSSVQFWASCRCSSDCYSHCSAWIDWSVCSDDGVPWPGCHKMASATDESSSAKYGGGSTCSAGHNCNMRSCILCACGLSVGVTAEGVTVTFKNDSNRDWEANQKHVQEGCHPCT